MNVDIIDSMYSKDMYLDNKNVVDRLVEEYHNYGNLIVAFDFDDTVYTEKPNGSVDQVIELLKVCNCMDFSLIVFTCRNESDYDFIENHLNEIGIDYECINDSSSCAAMPKGKNAKVFYNIFLDDRAGLKSAYEALVATIDILCKEGK